MSESKPGRPARAASRARSSCCATRRPVRTSTRACRPSSPTGGTSRWPGRRPACSSTSRTTWPIWRCEGPDALKLLSHLAVNSFENFAVDKAKHFVPCTPDGYVIGDVILFYLAENSVQPRRPRPRAQLDHATTPRPAATTSRSSSTSARRCARTGARKSYRFQVQGPNAMSVIEKALGRPAAGAQVLQHDDGHDRRAGRVRALRHGMVGQPGWELFGPWEDGEAVREALVDAPARTSACGRSAAAPTRRTRSSRAGSPRRCRPSTPASR